MRIGLGQLDIIWEEKKQNQKKCEQMLREARNHNVDLLIFPEMTLTGFSMNTDKIGELLEHSDTIDFFKENSVKYQMSIVFGYVQNQYTKTFNRLVLVDHGRILIHYAKIHPFSFGEESIYYQGGDTLGQCTLKDYHISTFICYDLRFPELFQICSAKSELLIVIANWPQPRMEHFQTLLKARAIENQCYVVGVNRVGEGNGLIYNGGSGIYDPYGTLITKETSIEKLIIGDIDKEIVTNYRKNFPQQTDKRFSLYYSIYKKQQL